MKKSIYIIIVSLFVVFAYSCGNKTEKHPAGTHTHADGTVHEGETHTEEAEPTAVQESFETEADTTAEHEHDHDHSDDHQH